jgi:hypothetical protein
MIAPFARSTRDEFNGRPDGSPAGAAISRFDGPNAACPRLDRQRLGDWLFQVEEINPRSDAAWPHAHAKLAILASSAHGQIMNRLFDPQDYAVVVKLRSNTSTPWKWEIYCAGKRLPVAQSETFFATRGAASSAGKEALNQLLERLTA